MKVELMWSHVLFYRNKKPKNIISKSNLSSKDKNQRERAPKRNIITGVPLLLSISTKVTFELKNHWVRKIKKICDVNMHEFILSITQFSLVFQFILIGLVGCRQNEFWNCENFVFYQTETVFFMDHNCNFEIIGVNKELKKFTATKFILSSD